MINLISIIKERRWKKAEEHLVTYYKDIVAAASDCIERAQCMQDKHKPLVERYTSGERTQALYQEIMSLDGGGQGKRQRKMYALFKSFDK